MGWKATWDEWLPRSSKRLRRDGPQLEPEAAAAEEPAAAASTGRGSGRGSGRASGRGRAAAASESSDDEPAAASAGRGAAASAGPSPMEESESGEESSGEESSGEESGEGSPMEGADSQPEQEQEEVAPRMTAAERQEYYQREMAAARAENEKHKASRAAATREKVEAIEKEKKEFAQMRVGFLLRQGELFSKFLGDGAAKLLAESPGAGEGAGTAAAAAAAAAPAAPASPREAAAAAAAEAKSPARASADSPSPAKAERRRKTEREEDEEYMAQQEEAEEDIPRLSRDQTKAFINGKMREYQVEGLNWLIRLYHRGLNGILADEMGLGKTLQSISLLAFLHKFKGIWGPHLVVVPKTTLGNWCKEFKRWYPALRVLKFHGDKDERALIRERDLHFGSFDVCVLSYEIAIREKSALSKLPWEYLVVDEAHRIKNENSLLSQIIRLYNSKCRLLVTGTPLQNNLHELWALLNFLLPDVFGSSEAFESFADAVGDEKQDVINQLHRILRPFILRRLKHEVERGIPSKKELTVYCKLAPAQAETYKAVLKNNVDVLNSGPAKGGSRMKLMNTMMQLRKACNHPYLFDGVEDKSLDPFGEHLITSSGKLTLLDKLLPRLQRKGSRVLIFSQMTRVLDILEDYCTMRNHKMVRIDGQTGGEEREQAVEDFNKPGSDLFVFLLSTRAGGLGINLATADVVVLYDSDWNPQMDLQAQDRAHRIGQTKPVKIFRLITGDTIEEKILDRAMKKLHLDALVIQSGRLVDKEKGLGTAEMLNAIRFGADNIFKMAEGGEELAEQDIDEILRQAEIKTKALNKKFSAAKKEGLSSSMWSFGGEDFKGERQAAAGGWAENKFVDIGKRDRKTTTYSESDIFNGMLGNPGAGNRKTRDITFQDFHFFDQEALRPLLEKARGIRRTVGENGEVTIEQVEREKLTEEEEELKEQLLAEGFGEWGRRDLLNFVRGCAEYGYRDLHSIAAEIEGKTLTEVKKYSAVFWERGPDELQDWEKHRAKIEEGERKREKLEDMQLAVSMKCRQVDHPLFEMDVDGLLSAAQARVFGASADRFLLWATDRLGWGEWDTIREQVRTSRSEPVATFPAA